MLAALRVAAGGCAPPITSTARRGRARARSGRESRFASRTGKRGLGRCGDHAVALGIEGDGTDRAPVAGLPAPAARVARARLLVQRVASGEHGSVLATMALCRGDIADATMVVVFIVPVDEGSGPLP